MRKASTASPVTCEREFTSICFDQESDLAWAATFVGHITMIEPQTRSALSATRLDGRPPIRLRRTDGNVALNRHKAFAIDSSRHRAAVTSILPKNRFNRVER